MQDNYTTKGKHLTIDSRRLIERWKKKENQIEKLPLYLEKLLKLSILKSSMGQSDNVLEKGASKRFILPTTLNSLMKIIASTRSRNQA
ncbi:transposase [Streptococcus pneumoniae]|nr:transposase [Streptococcus pneumoniae]